MPETVTINLTDHFWDTPPGALYSIAWDDSYFMPQRYVLGAGQEPGSVWCDYCQRWWGPDSFHARLKGTT